MTANERSKRIDDLKAEVTAGRGGPSAKSPADHGSARSRAD